MKRYSVIALLLLPHVALADCTECHGAYKARAVLAAQDDTSTCQGELQGAVDEVLYIEQRRAMLERIAKPLAADDVGYHWIAEKLDRADESYEKFLDKDVSSFKQLVTDKDKVCEKLRVVYLDINDSRDELKKRHIFGVLVLGSLLLMVFGLRAYLRMMPEPAGEDGVPGWEYQPERDDEPYKKMAARVGWPEVKPKAEDD